jgi:hypothetical protein
MPTTTVPQPDASTHAPADRDDDCDLEARQEDLIDEGLAETFPASDPVSVTRIT